MWLSEQSWKTSLPVLSGDTSVGGGGREDGSRRAIRSITDKTGPSSLNAFYERDFDFDFANEMGAFVWVNLAFQGLKTE